MYKLLFYILLFVTYHGYAQLNEVREYYPEDSTALKTLYRIDTKTGKLNGVYTYFYRNQKPQTIGYYTQGKATGLWKFYAESGKIQKSGSYIEDKPHGLWEYFHENGNVSMFGLIKEGNRQGTWSYFYENGNLKSKGDYKEGLKDGFWNYYYEDGKPKASAFYIQDSGFYKEFYPDGTLKMEGKNVGNASDSVWRYYFENGTLKAEGGYNDGFRNGLWRFYHENGKLSSQGNYKNGEPDGPWTYFHENGNLSSEGNITAGNKEGFWKLYFESGEISGEAEYKTGNGMLKEYYPSGKVKSIGPVVEQTKEGEWQYYNEEGRMEGKAIFENGEGKYTGYYESGKVKWEGTISQDKRVGDWILYGEDGKILGFYKPVYFEQSESKDKVVSEKSTERIPPSKHNYKYKNAQWRYFRPLVNEYRSPIIEFNPVFLVFGKIPFSMEYYFQQRLGYQLEINLIKSPFFESNKDIPLNDIYDQGYSVFFKQKFYGADTPYGMFYFGHQINISKINHYINFDNTSTSTISREQLTDNRITYSWLLGTRWMQDTKDRSPTIDIFIATGIGQRSMDKQYENTEVDKLFEKVDKNGFYVPFFFGINFGYSINKRKGSFSKS